MKWAHNTWCDHISDCLALGGLPNFQESQAMDLILSEDPSTEEPHVQLDAPMLGDGNMVDVPIIEVFPCSSFVFQSLGQFSFP
jgi:hypothetical protein